LKSNALSAPFAYDAALALIKAIHSADSLDSLDRAKIVDSGRGSRRSESAIWCDLRAWASSANR
jgi:ABC-type branched-subunit amino acid transport system substrate-binding protein